MYTLRQMQQRLCGHFGIVVAHSRNAVLFSKMYCASMKTAHPVMENDVHDGAGNERTRAAKTMVSIDKTTIKRLERLALVGFDYEHSKRVLEEAVAFAERLRRVQIDETVQPMYSTLENEHIHLRDDMALSVVDRCEILRNAMVREEEYFVAPLVR